MTSTPCPICGISCDETLTKTIDGVSVTSDSQYATTLDPVLLYCAGCAFWFTKQRRSFDDFYSSDYVLLMEDFFQDQLVQDGDNKTGRATYQARIISSLISSTGEGSRILEVGAGKGLTAHLVRQGPVRVSIELHDPGRDRYIGAWKKYVQVDDGLDSLEGIQPRSYDLGYSFFSLEHTPTAGQDLRVLIDTLSDEALFVGAVPYLAMNPGDLLVGDHCSHFTVRSLTCLMDSVTKGTNARAAVLVNHPLRCLVYAISRSERRLSDALATLMHQSGFLRDSDLDEPSDASLHEIAMRHWLSPAMAPGKRREVLWGAGFYSKLIMLRHRERSFTVCIDSNPDLVGTTFTDPEGRAIPVVHSEEWLRNEGSAGSRLWLGLSAKARDTVLRSLANTLAAADISVAT